jgi:hypothetical protein
MPTKEEEDYLRAMGVEEKYWEVLTDPNGPHPLSHAMNIRYVVSVTPHDTPSGIKYATVLLDCGCKFEFPLSFLPPEFSGQGTLK